MKPDVSAATFGAFDGGTSALGVLAGLIVAGAPAHQVLVAVGGLAVASAIGMAAGDYLSTRQIRASTVMGGATLVGTVLPALPVVLLPGLAGVVLGAVVMLALGIGIAEVRSREDGRKRGYATTFVVLVAVSALTVAVSLLLGVGG